MLTKDQRNKIAKKVLAKANATNNTLEKKHDEDVLISYALQRANSVISALHVAIKKAYSEVTPNQLLLAKHKLDVAKIGNCEARRKAKVAANRRARSEVAAEKKRLRIEARKEAALLKKSAENEKKSD